MRELLKYIPVGPIIVTALVFVLIPFDTSQAATPICVAICLA